MVVIMLTKWERKILLDKLHSLEVNPDHLRVVKYRVKKRLKRALADIQLIHSVFPDLMRGVGFPQKFTGKCALRRLESCFMF